MRNEETQTKKIPIRIDFEGEDAVKFEAIKDWLGLSQNTEVIRALISRVYREINHKEA